MSFSFQWPRFSDQFHADAIQLLNNALNKGNKPPVIADRIEVVELEMGTQPPELEIRDIGDLTLNQFRGIFRLTYSGDAHIVLRTKVQANPLYHKKPEIHLMGGSRGMLAANQPLIVPMLLRLSNFKLNSYVVLVVSKQKGITLVFKTDPLQNVDINSTFDSITVIQKFIQKEIEGQLRQMFREDLPGIIHRLSQQWIKKSTTVEAPYLAKQPTLKPRERLDTMSNPELMHLRSSFSSNLDPLSIRHPPRSQGSQRVVSRSVSGKLSPSTIRTPEIPEYSYDQDSGTFVSKVPETKAFSHLGRIHRESRGLADLAEEGSEFGGTDNEGSFDVVDWDDTMTDLGPPVSEANVTEYESIPAVGGGTITRPRVYHATSLLHTKSSTSQHSNSSSITSLTLPALQRLSQSTANVGQFPPSPYRRSRISLPSLRGDWDRSSLYEGTAYSESPQFQTPVSALRQSRMAEDDLEEFPFDHSEDLPSLTRQLSDTVHSGSSSIPSSSAVQLDSTDFPESELKRRSKSRRDSISSQLTSPFSPLSVYSDQGEDGSEPKIVLRPGFNNAISQLSLLNRSNHTLSPFTRPLEHFMIRSVPPRTLFSRGGSPKSHTERQPMKAKRKRVYRVGGSSNKGGGGSGDSPLPANLTKDEERRPLSTPPAPSSDPPWGSPLSVASDLDVSEIDRYFRSSRDEFVPRPRRESNLEFPLPQQQQQPPSSSSATYLRHRI